MKHVNTVMEDWDLTWANIIDSMIETDTGEDVPRFDVSNDDEILCKTEEDANCIADFLRALGFDICTAENENAKGNYRYEVYPNG